MTSSFESLNLLEMSHKLYNADFSLFYNILSENHREEVRVMGV